MFEPTVPAIDCHILHLDGENAQWRAECDASLLRNAEPFVRFHHMDGIAGDYCGARRRGFLFGSLPFVSFVDPDDLVCEGAFGAAFSEMGEGDAAVWTASLTIRGQRLSPASHARPHQLIIARREAVEGALRDGAVDDRTLWGRVASVGAVRHLPHVVGYAWRDHPGGHHWIGDDGFRMRNRRLVFERSTDHLHPGEA